MREGTRMDFRIRDQGGSSRWPATCDGTVHVYPDICRLPLTSVQRGNVDDGRGYEGLEQQRPVENVVAHALQMGWGDSATLGPEPAAGSK